MGGTGICSCSGEGAHDSKMTHGLFMKALVDIDVNSADTDDP